MMRIINLGACQDGRLPRLSAFYSSIYHKNTMHTVLLRDHSSHHLAHNVGRFNNIIR